MKRKSQTWVLYLRFDRFRSRSKIHTLQRITRILKPYNISFGKLQWSTVFSVTQMVAAKYSLDNRVFIVGDACHTHSPNAGQGANASMADGHNIAWKLAHILRGWASMQLLSTYEPERRTYAQGLIDFDKKLAQMMNKGDASEYSKNSKQQNLNTSGIGLTYNDALTLSGNKNTLLTPGARFPPFPITRLADWQAMDLQHLAPSNGLWKVIIFAAAKFDLVPIGKELELCDTSVRGRIEVNIVFDARAMEVHWRSVPSPLRQWERVFSGHPAPELLSIGSSSQGSVFTEYKIDATQGLVVLVRPDGHMSSITSAEDGCIKRIFSFVENM